MQVAEAVHQAPVLEALQPLALFRQKAALAGFQPALGVVRADTDVAVLRRDIDVAHHHQRLFIAEPAFQQLLQVAVEALLGRELGRVVTVFALWEVTIHDGHRLAVFVCESAPDKPALGVFFIAGKALVQFQGGLARKQGDTVMAFLTMKVHVIAQGFDVGEGELVIMDLGFLQADYVRLMFLDQRCQLMRPSAQAIDVE